MSIDINKNIGMLYLVGTPIGNLEDMSFRAIKTLREVDFIAAEDTRVTLKLLNHFDIKKPMISYYEHNKRERGEIICNRILEGETCALVSDAGMPAISDPGEDLVRLCEKKNIDVKVVPGPSALISSIAISGLATGRFTFEGFLSTNKKNRLNHLEGLKNEQRTMIFYEAPHKLIYTLEDLLKIIGNRKIAIARELTKIHEEILRTDIEEAIKIYKERPPRGEFVLVVEGKAEEFHTYTLEESIEMAKKMIDEEELSLSEASKKVAKITNVKKGDIYLGIISQNRAENN